jgi:hypothetical protein
VALHIDIPTPAQLATLLDTRGDGCVSIYLPTSPLPQDADQARIEFKNLAAQAPANELLADFAEDFVAFSLLAHSLAVFATPTSLRSFRLPNRLTSAVVVADRFHVKPLLRAVTFPQAALVLVLSQNAVRLIEVAGDVPPSEIEVAGLMEAVIAEQPRRYARQVDRALQPLLAGLGLPLILAATEPLNSFYRATNSYPGLLEDGIAGNAEHMTEAELAAAARPILDALYAGELERLRARFEEWGSRGRAATDLTDVARAADFGAVDTLFVDIDTDGDQDLDEIARHVLASGGRVLAVRRDDIPHGTAAAALLRYAV